MASKYINSKDIKIPNARLSFHSLAEPSRFDPDNDKEVPKYSAELILDPTYAPHKKVVEMIKTEIDSVIKQKWGSKPDNLKPIDFWGQGDTRKRQDDGQIYTGYKGMIYVKSKNAKRPLILDSDKSPLDSREVEDVFYGGCYVNAILNLWCQDHPKWGKAIRCQIKGLQFREDGEPFAGNSVSADIFDEFGSNDDGDEFGF
jgi:hypothetical protein